MREKVEAATGEFPPAWKPEPGDILEGPVVRRERFDGTEKVEPCDVAVIHDVNDDEEVSLFVRPVAMKRLFKAWNPQPKDYLCLRYIGEASKGKTKLYALAVDRVPPEVTANDDEPDDIPF